MELRFNVDLDDMTICDVVPVDALGISGARRLSPGPDGHLVSVLWRRMQATDSNRMPPTSSNVVDQAGADMIRYESVRDPEHAACVVLLRPSAFTRPSPRQQQTWFLAAARTHVRCLRDGDGWEFTRAQLIP